MGWYIALSVVGGFVIGVIVARLLIKKPVLFGFLNVFESTEPGEDPYLFLDLDVPPKQLYNEKYVTFEVSLK